jgi:hypothetical protein
MEVSMSVKNTFVYAFSLENADSAGGVLRHSSSCPSLGAADAPPGEDVTSDDIVSPLTRHDSDLAVSRFGTWADVDSDCDDQELPARLSSVGLSDFNFTGEIYNAPTKVDEKSPAALESIIVQTNESARTPLSSKASSFSPLIDSSEPHVPFVPFSPLNSKASAFVPRSSQVVSMPMQTPESTDASVPDTTSQQETTSHNMTTVMLRNLPCGFTRKALIWTMNKEGFAGFYNFVYIPIDFKSKLCKGYAFVNLAAVEYVQRLIDVFDGFDKWTHCSSSKVCKASLSHTQGLTANIERYRNSPVMGDDVPDIFKPVLFEGKLEVPFPEPTRQLPPIHHRMHRQ